MKSMKVNNTRPVVVMTCLLMVLGYVTDASAITRSCNAKLFIKNPMTGGTKTLEVFSAQGNCGSAVPNRCRQRAKDAAFKCMRIHWDKRWDQDRPEHCEPGAKIFDYSIQDLKKRIESKACSAGWGKSGAVKIDLYGNTSGDNKCGGTIHIHDYLMKENMC